MRRILLAGKNGQVGWELQRTLATLGEVVALDRHGMDLANPDSIRRAIREINPALIINAAAYTAVDKAESEPDLAMAINGIAPGVMAEEAKRLGAALIHYSTDYVFDGNKNDPYTEDDAPNPLNVYGRTKLVGEQAIQAVGASHLIFRTSWVYGMRGKNFLLTILRLAKERDELRVVNDQIGAPTWCRTIAEATAQVLAQLCSPATHNPSALTAGDSLMAHNPLLITDMCGIYHMSAGGETSWFGFANTIFENMPHSFKLIPIATEEYPLPAARPKYSVLSNLKTEKVLGLKMPSWQYMLACCCEDMDSASNFRR